MKNPPCERASGFVQLRVDYECAIPLCVELAFNIVIAFFVVSAVLAVAVSVLGFLGSVFAELSRDVLDGIGRLVGKRRRADSESA